MLTHSRSASESATIKSFAWISRPGAVVCATALLASFAVLSPLLGFAASVAGRALAPCVAAGLLLRGAPVTRHLKVALTITMVICGLGLVHGSTYDIGIFAAEMVAVAGVVLLLDLREDGAAVLRLAYVLAALACAGALLLATSRMQSSQHHVALGWVLGPGFALLLSAAFFGERRWRRGAAVGAVVVFLGAATSGSRASLVLPVIALLLVVLANARWSLHRKVGFIVAAVVGMTVVFPVVLEFTIGQATRLPGTNEVQVERQLTVLDLSSAGEDASLQLRYTELWPAAIRTISEHPFGTGFGSRIETEEGQLTYPHNLILEAGVAFGWVGLLIMAAFVAERFRSLVRVAQVRPDLATGGLTAVMGLMVSGSMRPFNLVVLTFGIAEFGARRRRR